MNGAGPGTQVLLADRFLVAKLAVLRIGEELSFWVVPWNGSDHNKFICFEGEQFQLALFGRIVLRRRINTDMIMLKQLFMSSLVALLHDH